MNKFRQFMKERSFIRLTFFIVFTAHIGGDGKSRRNGYAD